MMGSGSGSGGGGGSKGGLLMRLSSLRASGWSVRQVSDVLLLQAVLSARTRSLLWIALLLCVWFSSSIVSTLINKMLMIHFPYPVTISAVHMLSSVVVDWFIVLSRGLSLAPFRWDVFWQCLPVAATINFGKTLTYVSYGMVPASLTHTAKASSPVFSVLLTKLMYNKWPSTATSLSLLPLTLGVILSALTELHLVLVGFFAAIAAALANVLNSIYTKRAISHVACPDPIIFHMYTAATATLMLAPYAIAKDAADWLHGVHYTFDEDAEAADSAVALRLLLFSVSLHYLQNISSIYFLAYVSVLSHQVAQSLKRLMVIACSVLYFHTPVTALNVVGMGLALCGFFAYSLSKQSAIIETRRHSASSASASASDHSGSEREKAERDTERGYSSGGHRSAGGGGTVANARSNARFMAEHGGANHHNAQQAAPGQQQQLSSSPQVASSSSSSAASSSSSSSLFLPPSSPTPDSPLLDSYALVRQSELGSSHLLQSPATGSVQQRERYQLQQQQQRGQHQPHASHAPNGPNSSLTLPLPSHAAYHPTGSLSGEEEQQFLLAVQHEPEDEYRQSQQDGLV